MPNRIIKESICTSENVDQLTAFQETAFVRLIVNCDDFGRFFGNPKILASRLFPLKNVTPEEMSETLKALVSADLVTVYEVDGKPFVQMNTWADHQQTRAKKSKFPEPVLMQIPAVGINCNQMQSDDSKRPRNRYTNNDNRYSLSLIGDEEAAEINAEHDKVLQAAENAGFARNDATRAKLLDLYSVHGYQKMIAGFESCVEHGVSNIAYLAAVLKGEPKKATGKTVPAQNYTQRDYSGEQADAMQRMLKGAAG